MKNLFFFDSMLTPKIITIVYWLGMLGAVIGGCTAMYNPWYGLTASGFFTGLAIMAAGIVGTRIWCELMIVLFKIHENLQKIANNDASN